MMKSSNSKPKLRTNRNGSECLEAKRMKDIIFRYGLLVLFICLLIRSVTFLLERRNFGYDQYGNLMVVLMLLFNHIAFFVTKRGWLSHVMKTVAWIWLVFGFAYIFWIF